MSEPLKNGDKVYITRVGHSRYGEAGIVSHQMRNPLSNISYEMTRIIFLDGSHVWLYHDGFSRTKPPLPMR